MKLSKEDAVVRARALLSFGVSASLAIVKDDTLELGQAIVGIERTLEDMKAYHSRRVGWVHAPIVEHGPWLDDTVDERGSEG